MEKNSWTKRMKRLEEYGKAKRIFEELKDFGLSQENQSPLQLILKK